MAKSNFKEIEIRLRPASSLPDATCIDGEVAEFSNVDWLGKLIESQEGNSSDSPANGNTGSKESALCLKSEALPFSLPHGASLLAIHSPAALNGKSRFVILTSPDSLAIFDPDSGSITYLCANVSLKYGRIRRTVPYRDFILILSDNGLSWIIFNPSSQNYILTDINPDCPDVEFRLTPASMTGYNSVADNWPELKAAVDLPDELGVSQIMLHNWLDSGSNNAVSEEVRVKVYRAVGKAVEDYETAVRANGLYLTPPRCVASFDGVLPSAISVPGFSEGYNYSIPSARLISWGYHAGTLSLTLNFSLRPFRLSASFSIPDNQRIWISFFNSIDLAATKSTDWHDSGKSLYATGFTSYTDPATSQRDGYAFRFSTAFSPDQMQLRLSHRNSFRIIHKYQLGDACEGMLFPVNLEGDEWKSLPAFSPDYRDFTKVSPRDIAAVDQGFILFGGEFQTRDSEGRITLKSLEKSIIATHPDFPFIFRHICPVSDGRIVGVSQANGSRRAGDAGRHPLHAISTDGIRLLTADNEGGYINARLLSRFSAISDLPIATGNNLICFPTQEGIATLALNSSVALIEDSLPEGSWTDMVMLDDESLLLLAPGIAELYDLNQKLSFPQPEISIRNILRHEGCVIASFSDGSLMRLSAMRKPVTESTENIELLNLDSERSYVLTRPLKLGSPTTRKRIAGVSGIHNSITIEIEYSDNLADWHHLITRNPASYDGMSSGNHASVLYNPILSTGRLSSHRFYRLRLSSPPSLASSLASITLFITKD